MSFKDDLRASLSTLTVKQLRQDASRLTIAGRSKMDKETLIEAIVAATPYPVLPPFNVLTADDKIRNYKNQNALNGRKGLTVAQKRRIRKTTTRVYFLTKRQSA